MQNVFIRIKECLDVCDVEQKVNLTQSLYKDWCAGKLNIERSFLMYQILERMLKLKSEINYRGPKS